MICSFCCYKINADNYMKPADLGSRVSPAKVSTVTSSAQMRKMVALYDYDPQELSPNVDAEVRSL